MERLRSLDRRIWIALVALLAALWYGPALLWPYRHVVHLDAPGEVVAVLGDSIPAGYGETVGVERAWPTLVAGRLGLRLINQSVPGDTTEKGLARLDALLAQRPRLVVVELGGNDVLSRAGAEQTKANLDLMFERIQKSGAMVMYVSVPAPLAADYEQAWVASCREHGVYYVRNILKGIFGTPRLMFDSIHPNAAGHALIADRMVDEISSLLHAADRARGR